MESNILLILVFVIIFIMGVVIFFKILKKINSFTETMIVLLILVFVMLGITPSILVKLSMISQNISTVAISIIYFISFVCVASYVLIKKSVS